MLDALGTNPSPEFAVLSAENQLGVQDNVKREEKCTERGIHDIPELTRILGSAVPVPGEPPKPIGANLRVYGFVLNSLDREKHEL